MAILEGIVVGIGVHLGKKIVDNLWSAAKGGQAPVVDNTGRLGLTALNVGRTQVQRDFAPGLAQNYELVQGNLYAPTEMFGDEIPLVLIIEETQEEVLFFRADLDNGFEVYLPHGIYSFYAFLMEPDEYDFFEAEIAAVGFPSRVDLSQIEYFELDDHDEIWNYINDVPYDIRPGGPYVLNLILINTDKVPDFPLTFSELIGGELESDYSRQAYNLTGTWQLEEEYEFGSTIAEAYLVQAGTKVNGLILIHDVMDDGSELILQQSVSGSVRGTNLDLSGTKVRVIRGRSDDYFLDYWEGVIEDSNTISGISEDDAGTQGAFIMRRVSRKV